MSFSDTWAMILIVLLTLKVFWVLTEEAITLTSRGIAAWRGVVQCPTVGRMSVNSLLSPWRGVSGWDRRVMLVAKMPCNSSEGRGFVTLLSVLGGETP
jgi:hypothetical protein